MSKYLVTGGLGFIGSHLVDALLAAGHQVRVLDDLSNGRRENLSLGAELVVGSVTNADLVASCMADVDGCFHLAAVAAVARCTQEWAKSSTTNAVGTITVFEGSAQRPGGPVPVVFMSSAAVYGDAGTAPLAETAVPHPQTAYGVDKLASEMHARVAGRIHGVPTFGLRPFNVYGPRQDPRSPYSGVISRFIECILQGHDLTVQGDGGQSRDFVHVLDVVRFIAAAIDTATIAAPVANICTGRAVTILELASMMIDLGGQAVGLRYAPPRPGDIRQSRGDATLAAKVLGISTSIDLPQGLTGLMEAIH